MSKLSAIVIALLALPSCLEDTEVATSALATPPLAKVAVASVNGGGCWDFPLGLPSGTTPTLQQYPCHGQDNQLWLFEPKGTNVSRIHAIQDFNLCLHPHSIASGAVIDLVPCTNANDQLWTLDPATDVLHPINNLSLCLDVRGGVATSKAPIQLFACLGQTDQRWVFRQFVGRTTGKGCDTNMIIQPGNHSVAAGTTASFGFPFDTIRENCSLSDPQIIDATDHVCPAPQDWIVVDRRSGTGDFPISCFVQ
jgi:hypothetical protein